jgi:hypothetical protein
MKWVNMTRRVYSKFSLYKYKRENLLAFRCLGLHIKRERSGKEQEISREAGTTGAQQKYPMYLRGMKEVSAFLPVFSSATG